MTTKQSNYFWITLFLLISLLGAACTPTGSGRDELTMYVGAETADCVGVVPQQCLLVKFSPDAAWEFHYDGIEGFTYEPGFEYELLVNKREIADPPADGSSLVYELVAVVSKIAIEHPPMDNPLVGTEWQLASFGSAAGQQAPLPNSMVTMFFTSNREVGGSGGCNSYFGSYTLTADNGLQFGNIGMTEMACLEEGLMTQESEFLAHLATVESYVLGDGQLTLRYGGGELHFVPVLPEPPRSLVGTTWLLTTIETADTAQSLLADSQITAVFDGEQVSGTAGCNSYFGGYTLTDATLAVGEIGRTLMDCGTDLMQQEDEYLQALAAVDSVVIDEDQLRLSYEGGALVFVAAEEETAVPPQANTIPWEEALTILNSGEVVEVFQAHSLDVILILADGQSFHTIEPGIDDIFTAVSNCGEPCANIILATE